MVMVAGLLGVWPISDDQRIIARQEVGNREVHLKETGEAGSEGAEHSRRLTAHCRRDRQRGH